MKLTQRFIIAVALFSTVALADVSDYSGAMNGAIIEFAGFGDQSGTSFQNEVRAQGFDPVAPRENEAGTEDRRSFTFFTQAPVYWVNGGQASTMQAACDRAGVQQYPSPGWTYRLFNQGGTWMCRMYTPWNTFWVQQTVFRQGVPLMAESNSGDNGLYFAAPADTETEKQCLDRCNAQKEKDDQNLTLELLKMKVKYKTYNYAAAVGGALFGAAFPGKVGAVPAAVATYFISKEYTTDLIKAYQDLGELANSRRYILCKQQCNKTG